MAFVVCVILTGNIEKTNVFTKKTLQIGFKDKTSIIQYVDFNTF